MHSGGRIVKTVILLRGAAILAALQGLAHAALFISAKPRHGDAEVAVITAMKANRFFAGGLGYWDYYFGYGLIAAFACLVEAALLWQIARIAETQAALVRPMVVVFVVANLGHALLLARYFKFPLPIAFDLVIATVLVVALVAAASVSIGAGLSARSQPFRTSFNR
jgi:predicted ferric reductase